MANEGRVRARHLAAAVSLHLDAVTAEVVRAFRDVGVRSILLRGPAVGSWLSPDEDVRSYVDVDLLVEEATAGKASRCLEELGFEDVSVEGVLRGDRPTHAHTWSRADRALVDLHTTIVGVRIPAGDAWAILAADTETLPVAGADVEVLQEPAKALMLALHAAQHGGRFMPTLEDLERALARLPPVAWEQASSLARRLDAVDAFATGLRLLPAGVEVASRLELPSAAGVDVALRAGTPPPMALGFEWLSQTQGWRGRAALAARKIAPTPAFMRAWSPLARRGRAGLALAYAWRPIWILLHAGPAFLAWRRARNAVDDDR